MNLPDAKKRPLPQNSQAYATQLKNPYYLAGIFEARAAFEDEVNIFPSYHNSTYEAHASHITLRTSNHALLEAIRTELDLNVRIRPYAQSVISEGYQMKISYGKALAVYQRLKPYMLIRTEEAKSTFENQNIMRPRNSALNHN